MAEEITQSKMMQLLSWAYDKATSGKTYVSPNAIPIVAEPLLSTAQDIVAEYDEKDAPAGEKAQSIIRSEVAKATTSGFVTGLGGLLTMPVAIPANIGSVIYLQLRMIASVAILAGFDPKEDGVRTLAYCCLCNTSTEEIEKELGLKVGERMSVSLVYSISRSLLSKLSSNMAAKLATNAGAKGVSSLAKAVPILGGIIGGAIDLYQTSSIGNRAMDLFFPGAGTAGDDVKALPGGPSQLPQNDGASSPSAQD